MEKRDLYDENKNLTGETIYKGDKVPTGRYYITVVIWIQNEKGEFLIQKRVLKKDGKWSTTGGHPVAGKTSKEGIFAEIKEELGLDLTDEDIVLFKTIKTEDDFVDLYYLRANIDINDVVMQKEEVADVMWATTEEIRRLIENGEFSDSHAEFFDFCMEFINKNKRRKSVNMNNEKNVKDTCLYEKSAGVIAYKKINGEPHYLITYSKKNFPGFPKGHVEYGEKEEETARRELLEEAGIKVEFKNGFRESITYTVFNTQIQKEVVFFLGEIKEGEIININTNEISKFKIVTFKEAKNILNQDLMNVLKIAKEYIDKD